MEAVTDRIAQFSAAIALIYETYIADTQRESLKHALSALLDADELAFTTTRSAQALDALRCAGNDSSSVEDGETPGLGAYETSCRRSAGHILSLDIVDRGYDKLKLLALRNPDRAPFSERDLEWLSLLQPHLRNAEFIKTLMPGGMYGCAASSSLAQSMFEGLVITTMGGEVKWLNPIARDILAADQGLTCANGRLCARRIFETTQLDSLIRGAACGQPGIMLVAHASMWLPYGLAFAPLAFDFTLATAAPRESEHRFVLITIKDMQRHVDVITKRLAEVFGLTEAEERIGALLLTGHGLQAAATMMGKSLATVKKQLRSMLTKTGTHSRADLLSMFLSVPSLI